MEKSLKKTAHKFLKASFGGKDLYFFTMKVKDVINLYYVAVRGKDEEEGSVQRILSPARIVSISEFVLMGNSFVNTFVLNWTNKEHLPRISKQEITIPIIPNSAQAIDGQHRLAGLSLAMKKKSSIGDGTILVALCLGLDTKEAAKIFLNINTEQRPVPKSLVYDLYGVVFEGQEMSINRAADIAHELHENPESPYYGKIKFPGGVGRIELSTVVSALKKYLEHDGVLATNNLKSLENQKSAILSFFKALKSFYNSPKENLWDKLSENPFMRSTGFYAAIEYLMESLLLQCVEKKSFTFDTMRSVLKLDSVPLLRHEDISKLDGKTARKKIKDFLRSASQKDVPEEAEYEF